MYKIKPTTEQERDAWRLVALHNLGNRGEKDGTTKEQAVGVLGQIIVGDKLELPRMTASGFDGGIDFEINGVTSDIKTMTRKGDVKEDYVFNLVSAQMKYTVDYYIFASFSTDKRELTVCGVIPKRDVHKISKFYPKGTERIRKDGSKLILPNDIYEVPIKSLVPVNNTFELYQAISRKE